MRYTLSRGGLRAAVDSHGAELCSLRDGDGTEYIWQGDPAIWPGRSPLLFPIVGNLKGGQVSAGGAVCSMSRHGFARDCDFALLRLEEDSILLELRENDETLARYPFPFRLRVAHRLTAAGFVTSLSVQNPGPQPLPFCIGGHPAFRCPLGEGERFEEYDLVFDRPETADALPLTAEGLLARTGGVPLQRGQARLPLTREVFRQLDTIIFRGLRSTGVRLLHRGTGRGVRLDFSGFPMVAFWTKPVEEAAFLCLEPWHGCAALEEERGDFLDKPGCILLPPGAETALSYGISLCGISPNHDIFPS